jgi:alpha/beta superfamily hydrolase
MKAAMLADADKSPILEISPGSAVSETSSGAGVHGALRSFYLPGAAGRLEALLNEGHSDAQFAALICHPHPLGGGTMHNKVVYRAMKVFNRLDWPHLGWPVLRFNFRGTGLSEGAHDSRAEIDDVRVALDWLSAQYGRPIVAAGFSFGAAMGLEASCTDPRVEGFAAMGLPTHAEGRDYKYPFLPECSFPKLFVSGGLDEYASPRQLGDVLDSTPDPKRLVLVPGADHFFTGHLEAMQAALGKWLHETFPSRQAQYGHGQDGRTHSGHASRQEMKKERHDDGN